MQKQNKDTDHQISVYFEEDYNNMEVCTGEWEIVEVRREDYRWELMKSWSWRSYWDLMRREEFFQWVQWNRFLCWKTMQVRDISKAKVSEMGIVDCLRVCWWLWIANLDLVHMEWTCTQGILQMWKNNKSDEMSTGSEWGESRSSMEKYLWTALYVCAMVVLPMVQQLKHFKKVADYGSSSFETQYGLLSLQTLKIGSGLSKFDFVQSRIRLISRCVCVCQDQAQLIEKKKQTRRDRKAA